MTMIIVCIVLGVVSFVLAQMISVSQIVSLFRTKNTSGVSIWTYIIFMFAGAMCLFWGLSYYYQEMTTIAPPDVLKDLTISDDALYTLYQWTIIPIIAYYITDFCMSTTMMIIKARHLSLCKQLHMDELKLAEYLKDQTNKKYLKSNKRLFYHPDFVMWLLLSIFIIIVVLFMSLTTVFGKFELTHCYYEEQVSDKYSLWPTYPWGQGLPWIMWTSLFAALLWEAISWPQFIKSLREKDTSGISMNWAIFMPVSLTISFGYALALALKSNEFSTDTIGALVANGMIVNYGILIIKIINRKKAKAMGLTEVQYTKKVLIPAYEKKQAEKAKAKR